MDIKSKICKMAKDFFDGERNPLGLKIVHNHNQISNKIIFFYQDEKRGSLADEKIHMLIHALNFAYDRYFVKCENVLLVSKAYRYKDFIRIVLYNKEYGEISLMYYLTGDDTFKLPL